MSEAMTPSQLQAEIERLQRECLEWQAALHHAETEARQCGFSGSIREPGPALLEILAERDGLRITNDNLRSERRGLIGLVRAELEDLTGTDNIKLLPLAQKIVADYKALAAERDEARAQAAVYEKLADIAIETLRPVEESEHKFAALYQEARAQAARLAEALRSLYRWAEDDAQFVSPEGEAYRIIKEALASTDARAWMEGQKREAQGDAYNHVMHLLSILERCPDCRVSDELAKPYRKWLDEQIAAELESWRAARAIKPECVVEVDERIAELRRKEPCCGCVCPQAPDKDRHCPCRCHAELLRKEGA